MSHVTILCAIQVYQFFCNVSGNSLFACFVYFLFQYDIKIVTLSPTEDLKGLTKYLCFWVTEIETCVCNSVQRKEYS
jgi:hypothetical protein